MVCEDLSNCLAWVLYSFATLIPYWVYLFYFFKKNLKDSKNIDEGQSSLLRILLKSSPKELR